MSGLVAAGIMAIAGLDTGEALGLVAGIVFTAIVIVAAAWRNG